jgi:hypothetical protein
MKIEDKVLKISNPRGDILTIGDRIPMRKHRIIYIQKKGKNEAVVIGYLRNKRAREWKDFTGAKR